MTDLPFRQWAALETHAKFTQPTETAMHLTAFEKKIRRRNFIEYAAGLLVIAIFAVTAWFSFHAGEYFIAASWLTLIAGNIMVIFNLRQIASNLQRSPETDCRSHLRAQLVHQRTALRSVPKWYIGPLVPGLLLALIAMISATAKITGLAVAIASLAAPALAALGILGGVIWLNSKAADKLSDRIAELDKLAAPS